MVTIGSISSRCIEPMVTSHVMKITKTCFSMIGHLFDTIFVGLTVKISSTGPSKYNGWKVLETITEACSGS